MEALWKWRLALKQARSKKVRKIKIEEQILYYNYNLLHMGSEAELAPSACRGNHPGLARGTQRPISRFLGKHIWALRHALRHCLYHTIQNVRSRSSAIVSTSIAKLLQYFLLQQHALLLLLLQHCCQYYPRRLKTLSIKYYLCNSRESLGVLAELPWLHALAIPRVSVYGSMVWPERERVYYRQIIIAQKGAIERRLICALMSLSNAQAFE